MKYVLEYKDGGLYGPFDSADAAVTWAKSRSDRSLTPNWIIRPLIPVEVDDHQ